MTTFLIVTAVLALVVAFYATLTACIEVIKTTGNFTLRFYGPALLATYGMSVLLLVD